MGSLPRNYWSISTTGLYRGGLFLPNQLGNNIAVWAIRIKPSFGSQKEIFSILRAHYKETHIISAKVMIPSQFTWHTLNCVFQFVMHEYCMVAKNISYKHNGA